MRAKVYAVLGLLTFVSSREGSSPLLLSIAVLPLLLHLTATLARRNLLLTLCTVATAQFLASLSTYSPLLSSRSHAYLLQVVWSSLTASGMLLPVTGYWWITRATQVERGSWANMMIFPLLWTVILTIWQVVSPFGRLAAPTPGPSASALPLMFLPILRAVGQPGLDFMIGSAAVRLYTLWRSVSLGPAVVDEAHRQIDLLGAFDDSENPIPVPDEESSLVAPKRSDDIQHAPSPYNTFASMTQGRPSSEAVLGMFHYQRPASLLFGLLTLAIVIPGAFFAPTTHPSSLSHPLTEQTPVTLACILPKHPATLNSLVQESTRLASQAKVLVWPETALQLSTVSERDDVLRQIEELAKKQGVWIAAGLSSLKDVDDGARVRRKNEVVFVGPSGVIGSYEKRKLVPLIESYAHEGGEDDSPAWTIELPPPAHVSKSTWNAQPPHHREFSVSPLICLDAFHSPALPPVASLFLLPSSSPSADIAVLLLRQAQTLSVTHGTFTLMCDGAGANALSALVDEWGRILYQQSGGGSFVVHTALGWNGEATSLIKTGWETLGATGVLAVLLAAALLGSVVELTMKRGKSGVMGLCASSKKRVVSACKSMSSRVRRRIRNSEHETQRETETESLI